MLLVKIVCICTCYLLLSLVTKFLKPIEVKRGKIFQFEWDYKSIGVIDIVWLTLFSGVLGLILYARNASDYLLNSNLSDLSNNQLESLYSYMEFILSETIDSIFTLGTILAGAMAILWAGEICRKKSNPNQINHYSISVKSSAKMTFAYFFIVVNVFIWFGSPLYFRIIELLELIK